MDINLSGEVLIIGQEISITMDYGDEVEIMQVIVCDWILFQLQQLIDSDHVMNDIIYQQHENGMN